MKKLFILSFASILLLTGCGATETLSCSYQRNANNGTSSVMYDIDHEGDEVKKVRITYNYDFDGNTTGDTDTNATNRARVGDNNTANGATNGTNGSNNNNNDMNDADTDASVDGNNNGTTTNSTDTNNNMTENNATTNNNGITGHTDTNGNHTDGVGTGTDGTTNDTQIDDDGVIDGVIGSAIDTIVGGVTDIILDSAGLRDRHATVQNTYGDVTGFSVQNTNNDDGNYKVTYVIDYDTISDDDLARLNLSRELDELRDSYVNQGFTCK